MSSTPRDVYISVDFFKIGQIDNLNEKFLAEIRIESKWKENYHLNNTEYNPQTHWNPKLYVQNLLTENKDIVNYKIQKENDYSIISEIRVIKGQFWERLELQNCPFDLQELNIIIRSKHDSNKINLIADTENCQLLNQETRRTFADQQKWRLFNIMKMRHSYEKTKHHTLLHFPDLHQGQSESLFHNSNSLSGIMSEKSLKKYSKLVATCYCSRRPGFYIFNAFFLIFLITASSLTVFSIPNNMPANRLQITYTILLSSISFKWIFNRFLPPVSYLTLLDKYSISCIVYINLLAAWHSLVGTNFFRWNKSIDFYMLISFVMLFLLFHLALILWYFKITKKIRFLNQMEKEFISDYLLKTNRKSLKDDDDEEDD